MKTYDVIIAGCGPAGATAGCILARYGLSTAIIDKAVFPRPKLCGGLLPIKTIDLIERVFGETRESLTALGIINYTSFGYQIYFRDQLIVHKSTEYPFSFVDREAYDHFLQKKAQSEGAFIIEGERISRIDPDGCTLTTDKGKTYHARFIIGADGVHSTVKRHLSESMNAREENSHDLAAALEVFIPNSRLRRRIECPMIHLGLVDWGYAWVFPNRDRVIIGLGGLPKKNTAHLKKTLSTYLSMLDLLHPGETLQDLKIHGHPIPYGNMTMRPLYRNIVLAGDAAGLADSITGEGIYYAHRSAEVVAESIIQSIQRRCSFEEICPELLRKHVYPELQSAWRLRLIVFNALKILPPVLIRILVKWGNNRALKVIHGLKPYPFNARSHEMYGDIHA